MKKLLAAVLIALPLFAAKPVTIKGSDTMVIMNARLAETFMSKMPGTTIQVTGGGSGTGGSSNTTVIVCHGSGTMSVAINGMTTIANTIAE